MQQHQLYSTCMYACARACIYVWVFVCVCACGALFSLSTNQGALPFRIQGYIRYSSNESSLSTNQGALPFRDSRPFRARDSRFGAYTCAFGMVVITNDLTSVTSTGIAIPGSSSSSSCALACRQKERWRGGVTPRQRRRKALSMRETFLSVCEKRVRHRHGVCRCNKFRGPDLPCLLSPSLLHASLRTRT